MLSSMSKEQWGRATWYLFHTLSHNLKPERTDLVGPLLNVILNMCANLPCQDCSGHAERTMASLRKDMIKTPRDLAMMMWMFHNKVNERLRARHMTLEEHDEMYSRARLVEVVNHFMAVMNQRMGNERAMVYSMSRRNAVAGVLKFVKNNVDAFNT